MEAHPSIVEEAMAVEPTDANESAAAPQGAGSEVLLEDTDLESPSKKRKVCCKIICTLMCMFSIVPNMYRVSHSACVSERVFPTYYKTGDSPFRKKMESLELTKGKIFRGFEVFNNGMNRYEVGMIRMHLFTKSRSSVGVRKRALSKAP